MSWFSNYSNPYSYYSIKEQKPPSLVSLYNKAVLNQKENENKQLNSQLSSLGQLAINQNPKSNYHYLQSQQPQPQKPSLPLSPYTPALPQKTENDKTIFTNTLNTNFLGLYGKKESPSIQTPNSNVYKSPSSISTQEVNNLSNQLNNMALSNEDPLQKKPSGTIYRAASPFTGRPLANPLYLNNSNNSTNNNNSSVPFSNRIGYGVNMNNNNNNNPLNLRTINNNVSNNNYYQQQQLFNHHGISTPNINQQIQPHSNVDNNSNNNNSNTKKILVKFAYATKAGADTTGRTKTNQDSFLAIEHPKQNNINDITSLPSYSFGVFDGHGFQGHLVSQAIKSFFTSLPATQYQSFNNLQTSFVSLSSNIKTSTLFDSSTSGSTCVVVHFNQALNKIICANCGDSRAIMITESGSIIPLSNDHKPDLPEERRRIEQSGGRVDRIYGLGPFRVWLKNENYPGLAMSRSIGDGIAHSVGVSDIPEIKEFLIDKMNPICIVVASDGVWEFTSNEEIKAIIMKYYHTNDAEGCANEIVLKARTKWESEVYAIDDITVVVAFIQS